MGRMQMKAKGKGISGSALPYKRKAPKWITMTPSAVNELIVKLAKKGILLKKLKIYLFFPNSQASVRARSVFS